jgi:hypothetical protein
MHFFLYPVIRQYLKFDINEINVGNLEKSVKSPLDRDLFYSSASLLAVNECELQEGGTSQTVLTKSASDERDE